MIKYSDIILEYKDEGGKFDRKKSPLTPQQHSMGGKLGPIEFIKNAMDIRRKIKASPKGSDVHYAREGGVKTNLERLTKLYSRIKGRKFTAGSLEHPDWDPEIKGNKGHKIAARKYGEKAATRGQEVTWGKNKDDKEAFAQADFERKEPTESELVQRNRNRTRRRGHDAVVRGQQKKGRTVVGTLGAGHFKEFKEVANKWASRLIEGSAGVQALRKKSGLRRTKHKKPKEGPVTARTAAKEKEGDKRALASGEKLKTPETDWHDPKVFKDQMKHAQDAADAAAIKASRGDPLAAKMPGEVQRAHIAHAEFAPPSHQHNTKQMWVQYDKAMARRRELLRRRAKRRGKK